MNYRKLFIAVIIILLMLLCLLATNAQRGVKSDIFIYSNFIVTDSIADSNSVFNYSAKGDIINNWPVSNWDYVRIDSVSGYPRVRYIKYYSIDGVDFFIHDSVTIDYSHYGWQTTNGRTYFDTVFQNNGPLNIKRIKNSFEPVDSTQGVGINNDMIWMYYK